MAVSSWREPGGVRRGRFTLLDLREPEPPVVNSSGSSGTATRTRAATNAVATERALRLFLAEFEKVVAAHPEQWVSALSPIWDVDEDVR